MQVLQNILTYGWVIACFIITMFFGLRNAEAHFAIRTDVDRLGVQRRYH